MYIEIKLLFDITKSLNCNILSVCVMMCAKANEPISLFTCIKCILCIYEYDGIIFLL